MVRLSSAHKFGEESLFSPVILYTTTGTNWFYRTTCSANQTLLKEICQTDHKGQQVRANPALACKNIHSLTKGAKTVSKKWLNLHPTRRKCKKRCGNAIRPG